MSLSESLLQVGDLAPDFELVDDAGAPFRLSSLRGQRVVLYFYPRANTPGCTTEACDFRDRLKPLAAKGTVVAGISPDKPAALAKFKERYELSFPLVSDPEKVAAQAYGVWKEKVMYGKKVLGIERSTFVIAPDGTIEKIYRKVKAAGHAEKVLQDL
jgi:thioredoxin-dependent peroxiredoxin